MKKNLCQFRSFWMLVGFCLFSQALYAGVPGSWLEDIGTYQYYMPIMARVQANGEDLNLTGSKLAVYYNGELRGVADYDNRDGYSFFNLAAGVADMSENGFYFRFYYPAEDKVYGLVLPSELNEIAFKDTGYGNFNEKGDFEPLVLTVKPCFDCSLTVGWNIISPTVNLDESSLQALLAMKPLRLEASAYVQAEAEDIQPGVALWVFSPKKQALNLLGTDFSGWKLVIPEGWSLVGVVEDVPQEKLPGNLSSAWSWTSAGYCQVTELKAGIGYWVCGTK